MAKRDEIREWPVEVWSAGAVLAGSLALPSGARGVVLFAHGSGSSRLSPRNQHVARVLQEGGVGTLLFDLLTLEEEEQDLRTAELRFDIELLTERVVGAIDWVAANQPTAGLALGLFGSSTGSAAALRAASTRPEKVAAVVSRGGRPDLAAEALPLVKAPTLLIVGGRDEQVIRLNRLALAEMVCSRELQIVPGATHLFEEPGTLDQVAELAREWFQRYLGLPREEEQLLTPP